MTATAWIRVALGVVGLAVLVEIVVHIGVGTIVETLRPALVWLPLIGVLEVPRIASETRGGAGDQPLSGGVVVPGSDRGCCCVLSIIRLQLSVIRFIFDMSIIMLGLYAPPCIIGA